MGAAEVVPACGSGGRAAQRAVDPLYGAVHHFTEAAVGQSHSLSSRAGQGRTLAKYLRCFCMNLTD